MTPHRPDAAQELRGMLLALVGVVMFGATLPATRIAVAEFDPWWLAFARAELAAALAAVALIVTGQRRPTRKQWPGLALTALGVVLGFPLFSSIAMRSADASHAAVVNGLLPFATVIAATLRSGERPAASFWLAALAGSAVVAAFALRNGGGTLAPGDWAMLAAVAGGALGYAEGGRLARSLGGWQTIAWALIVAAPILALPALWLSFSQPFASASPRAWAGFLYVSVFSQLIGFLFWYGGMAIGGVARVSQVQLLQLFFTLIFAWWLLDERVDTITWLVAGVVVALIAVGRRAPVRRAVARPRRPTH
jgi:drug/metabolite transporter (DMT)-like permease